MPKLNNNDGSYVLLEWQVDDGGVVSSGAVVALIETSKTMEDLLSPTDGVLHHRVAAKAECRLGDIIGYVFASEADRLRFVREQEVVSRPDRPEEGLVITAPAREAMDRLGVTVERVRALGKKVIVRSDVESLEASTQDPDVSSYPLTRQQRRVADVVSWSHASVPAAFTAMWVDATSVATVRQELRAATARTVGVAALLIKAVAILRDPYPLFFGAFHDDYTVHAPAGVQIGITVDAGHGLYLAVLRDAASQSVAQVAAALAGFQEKARHGTFREDELTGANIGLSLNTYVDVHIAQPIIFPGTSCMLSLSGMDRDPQVDAASVRTRFSLGLAYDHRVVNGRDAVIFLREIKSTLEHPGRLRPLALPGLGGHVD